MSTYDPPRPWIRSYADGVPADLPEVTGSLLDIVASSARDYPDAPALQFFGRETTYRELMDAVEHAAAALQATNYWRTTNDGWPCQFLECRAGSLRMNRPGVTRMLMCSGRCGRLQRRAEHTDPSEWSTGAVSS